MLDLVTWRPRDAVSNAARCRRVSASPIGNLTEILASRSRRIHASESGFLEVPLDITPDKVRSPNQASAWPARLGSYNQMEATEVRARAKIKSSTWCFH